MTSHSDSRTMSRLFSGVAGALVVFLGMASVAPAFAVVGAWSTPVTLSVSGRDARYPQVAVDGSGNTVAVWYRFDGRNDVVQSSGSSDGGVSWSTPVNLSASGQFAENPQVAVDGSGNAVAAWHRGPPNVNIVQSSFSSASNGGGGGEELADTGAGGTAGDTALVASVGLLALGVLTRVLMRRRGVGN